MNLKLLFWIAALCCCCPDLIQAQCVSGAINVGSNANLVDDGNGNYSIACDGGGVDINASLSGSLSNVTPTWTNGQSGNTITFLPDCNNLGCQEFTPCIPANTPIPQQCLTFGQLGIPSTGSGNNFNLDFSISDFCYVEGMTYSGELGINLSGSGDVSLSVIQPDGAIQGPLTFDIALINDLSPVPLSLLGLNVDPNGDWTIQISGGGLTGYNIDSNSEICLEPTTTSVVTCGDPVEICVFGGCPSFISLDVSTNEICSGGAIDLSATLDPEGAPNVTYNWTGTGIANANAATQSLTLTNTGCAPITEVYTLDIICTNDGSTVVSGQQVSVTVYPEIDAAQAVIDNTTNINDPNCSIDISYPPCPGFTITGNTTFAPGDNGTTADFVISNGNTACDVTVSSVVNCIGDCTPPDVTVTPSACANGEFTIDVVIDALNDVVTADVEVSDGTVSTATADGDSFTYGPYPSGTIINIKVLDSNDPNCSINLGEFTVDCFACPELTGISPVAPSYCDGAQIVLGANVSSGTDGVDYTVQWFENGNPIGAGDVLTYNVSAGNRCNVTATEYTAEITCLNGGTEAIMTTASVMVDVYPIPEEGIDFVFENCSVTPIDNCGGTLEVDLGGATDPAPGGSSIVNYVIAVAGGTAANCTAEASTTVVCPNCTDYPGNGVASETVLCWGDSFDFSNASALVSTPGYQVGYTITPNPPSDYPSTQAMIDASIGGAQGPFPAPGSISGETYINDGSLIANPSACGDVLYFTPFLSFVCQSFNATNESGTIVTENLDGIDVPGVGGTSLAVPQVPFCSNGSVSYNIQVCVDDATTDGEEPLQEDALLGIIGGLPGGIFSNFPNIDDIHDSDGFPCYNQNGWTQNPSGEQISIVTVNLLDLNPFELGPDELDWTFSVDVNCNSPFPALCPDCDVMGAPVAVRFLPQETLTAIAAPAPICEGDAIDLTALNPTGTTNTGGNYTWYEGAASAGITVANATALVPPVGTTQYCVTYDYCETGDCIAETCVDITVNPSPVLTAPVLGPICAGESFDLTSVEASITADAGTFTWSVGSGASLATPASVTPVASEQYCATFTDGGTGCEATICASFTYTPVPVLLSAAPVICEGSDIELTDFNAEFTTDAGSFDWYDADPATGAVALTSTVVANVTDGTEFWVIFTDAASGCSATASMIVTVTPAPVLVAPTAELCEGDMISLADLEASVTTDAGTFEWYLGMSDIGFPVADPTMVSPVAGDEYCVVFTDDATTCSAEVCFTPTVNPLPIFTDYAPPAQCAGVITTDLTGYEGSLGSDDFTWFDVDPVGGDPAIADPTLAPTPDGSTTTFWFTLSTAEGCTDTSSIDVQVYEPISGATVAYDCGTGVLSVDAATAIGGSGSGYIVAADSPNMDGDLLNDGDTYTVIIEDGFGCRVTITEMIMCCQAMGPTITSTGVDCGDGSLGLPIVLVDGADGSTNPGEVTEYILTTLPNDTIRLVGNFADMQAYIDTMSLGNTACVQSITHTQSELDIIIGDLDACTTGGIGLSLYDFLGLPATGNTLQGIIDAIQGSAIGAGVTFTIGDIETLIGGSGGGPGEGGQVDLGELLGLGAGILVCDILPFCYNISDQVCVTVGDCGCNAIAPTLEISGTDCGDGTLSAPFVLIDNMDGSNEPGEIVEYILTTAPNDTIRFVGDAAGIAATLDGLPADSTVCVQPIIHNQAELDQVIADLDACTVGGIGLSLYGFLGLPTTGNSLEGIIDAIQGSAIGAGVTFTIGDIETLIGGSGGGPGAGGSVDLGDLLGLGPGVLVCDIPAFCYKIGGQVCVTSGECSACPTVLNITPPTSLCSAVGATTQVCVDFDDTVDATVSITVDGVVADGTAGGTQICADVAIPANNGCGAIPYDFVISADCDGTAIDVSTIILTSTQVYPAQPTASITNAGNVCSAATGVVSVELLAADGATVCGTVQTFDASANTTCNSVDELFDYSWTAAELEALLGGTGCYTDISGTETVTVYPEQPTVTLTAPAEACSNDVDVITAELVVGVEVCATETLNAPMNDGCDASNETINYGWLGADIETILGGTGCYADANASTTLNVLPSDYTLTIVNPDCVGENGSASLVAIDGTNCETQDGITGALNVCPATDGTDASLSYDFSTFNTSCYTAPVDVVTVNCDQPCDCPADPDLTIDVTDLCGSGDVTLSAAFLGGTGTGTLTITESTGTITNIQSGIAVSVPANTGCAPVTYTFDLSAECSDGSPIPGGLGTIQQTVTVYPAQPTASITNAGSACSAATGVVSIELLAADGATVCGTAQTFDASANATCNPVDESFDYSWTAAELETLLGGTGCYTDVSGSETISVFPEQPTITIYAPLSTCATNTTTPAQLMVGTNFCGELKELPTPENEGCFGVDETLSYTWTAAEIAAELGGDATCYEDVTDSATFTVYPSAYQPVVVVNPDCNGGNGSATVLAIDGTNCGTVEGTAGILNVCPATDGVDAVLDYDFTNILNNTCIGEPMDMITISCDQPCDCPADPDLTVSANEICSGTDVSFTAEFLGGTGTGSLIITETSGTVTNIPIDGSLVSLPENTTCSVQTYTFELSAICSDGSPIPNGSGTVSQTVSVYPNDVSSFITTSGENTCNTAINIDASCGGILTADVATQSASTGDGTGTHTYNLTYDAGGFGASCIPSFTIEVSYLCTDPCDGVNDITESGTICSGGSFTASDGNTYSASTVVAQSDENGCAYDLIIDITEYTVIDPEPINAEICEGESYTTASGTVYTESGSEIVIDGNGCETTLVVNITTITCTDPCDGVNDITESGFICPGGSFTASDGNTYSASTVVAQSDENGCAYDLIIDITEYTVTDPEPINAEICEGESYTTASGMVYTESGSEIVLDGNGCETTLVVNITTITCTDPCDGVNDITESGTICPGGSFTASDGNTYSASTVVAQSDENGCAYDLIIDITEYTVTDPEPINAEICEGESYTTASGMVYTESGSETVLDGNGCETTLVVNITTITCTDPCDGVNDITESGTICPGGSFTASDGNTYSASTVVAQSDENGCAYDLIIDIIEYTVIDPEPINAEICEGESYTTASGTVYTESGSEIVLDGNGCETTLVVNITTITCTDPCDGVNDITESGFICPGGSFTASDGNTYSASTVVAQSDENGCAYDLIIDITEYTVTDPEPINAEICEGESYTTASGTVYTESGNEIVIDGNGCETTLVVTLTILDCTDPEIDIVDPCSCDNPNNFFVDGVGYVEDHLIITSDPGEIWTSDTYTGLVNNDGTPFSGTITAEETASGVYDIYVYYEPIAGYSIVFTNEASEELSIGASNLTQCLCEEPKGSISGNVFSDDNSNGNKDGNEDGIEGVEVTITYPDGTTASITTDADGNYMFDDLEAGNYTITVTGQIPGTTITTVSTYTVDIDAGEDYIDGTPFGFGPEAPECIAPVATFTAACNDDGTFSVIIDISDVGNSTSLVIVDNAGSTPIITGSTGTYAIGNYSSGSSVNVTVAGNVTNDCFVAAEGLSIDCGTTEPCEISIAVTEDCDDFNGTQANTFIITGGSGAYIMTGDFNGPVNEGQEIDVLYVDGQTTNIQVVDANDSECTAAYEEIINCASSGGCEISITTIEDCNEDTNDQTNTYFIDGGSGEYTISGDFNGTVNAGESFSVDYVDGQTTNIQVVDAAVSECTAAYEEIVNCAKAGCDIEIAVSEDCDDTTNDQTNTYIITGGSGEYTISGDFNGTVEAGETFTVDYIDGQTTNIQVVDTADSECTAAYEEIVNCAKAGCDISIAVSEDCNDVTNDQTNTYIITGGSGEYAISGDFNGTVEAGEAFTVDYIDGQTTNIQVVDVADAECTAAYEEIVNCAKAGCDISITVSEDCNDVTNDQTNTYIITGGSGEYAISGDFNGTVEAGEAFTVDYIDGQTTNIQVVDVADAECTDAYEEIVNCAKAGCDISISVTENCDPDAGIQSNIYLITGGSGSYTVSGDFNGTNEGEPIEVFYNDGVTTNLVVTDVADDTCTQSYEEAVNCAKAIECDLAVTVSSGCTDNDGNEAESGFYFVCIDQISGGSGNYNYIAGQCITVPAGPYVLTVVDEDLEDCSEVIFIEGDDCDKVACDLAVVAASGCNDLDGNTAPDGLYYVCIVEITGGSGNYNYIPGECILVPSGPYILTVSDEDLEDCIETVYVEGNECDKADECDLSIEAIAECPTEDDGTYNLYILVTGTTPNPAIVSGTYNGEVNIGELVFVGAFEDGFQYTFTLDAPCDATITDSYQCIKDCAEVNAGTVEDITLCNGSGEGFDGSLPSSGTFTSDGDAGGTWTIDGVEFDGTVNEGDFAVGTYTVVYTVENEDVENGTVDCADAVSNPATLTIVDCAVVEPTCDTPISAELTLDCEEDANGNLTNLYAYTLTVSGGSGAYNISGDLNISDYDGSEPIVGSGNSTDGNITITITDADPESVCDPVTIDEDTSACNKACDAPLSASSESFCNEDGTYSATITISGGSDSYYIGTSSGDPVSSPVIVGPFMTGSDQTVVIFDTNPGCGSLPVTVVSPEDCTPEECGSVDAGMIADITLCDQEGGAEPTSGQFVTDGVAGGNWSIDGGASIADDGTVDATGLIPGAYTVTYTVVNPDLSDGTVCEDAVATAILTVIDCTPAPETGSIGDTVFEDTNGNGVQDADEPGISGVTVTLTDADGNTMTVTTDENGNYLFDDLPAGDYTVEVGAGPDGSTLTTSGSYDVSLGEGEDNLDNDFGFQPATPETGSIGDTVFEDTNGNGVQDADEPGISGVTVTLTDADGNTMTATTDENGNYLFDDLPAGDYTVEVGAGPDGSTLTTSGSFDVSLGEGEDNLDNDFGFQPAPACDSPITANATIECGVDVNGFQDGTFNVVVAISGGSGSYNLSGTVQETGNDGVVAISGLAGEAVNFTISDPDGLCDDVTVTVDTNECAKSCDEPLSASAETVCNDDGTYSAIITVDGGSGTYVVNNALSDPQNSPINVGPFNVGENITINIFDLNPACGAIPVSIESPSDCDDDNTGSIGSTVFFDENGNGVQDGNEPGIPDVLITLVDSEGNVIGTTLTDENGNYIFDNLPAGDYTIIVGIGPDGTYNSSPNTVDVSIDQGEDSTGEADFGFAPCATVSGVVYIDDNGNGMYDVGEGLVAGATVTLTDSDGNVIGVVTTGADGVYDFDNCLTAGDYTVTISGLPDGFTPTTDISFPISVETGDTLTEADGNNFGVAPPDACDNPIVIDYETICISSGNAYTLAFTISGGSGVYNMPAGDFIANGLVTGIVYELVVADGDNFTLVVEDADAASTCAQFSITAGQDEPCDIEEVCDGFDIGIIQVCPEVESTGFYDVIINVIGGTAPYTINGLTFSDSSIQLGPFPEGENLTIFGTDSNDCTVQFSGNLGICPITSVELIRFEGEVQEAGNYIHWITATETDNDYFTLERSLDGVHFEAIAYVNGAGTSVTPNAYSFMDNEVSTGDHFYRLKDTDFNGNTEIVSDVIVLNRAASFADIAVYPIPASDVINVEFTSYSTNSELSLKVYDVTGKVIDIISVTTENGLNVNQLDISDYAVGAYFISLTNDDEVITTRFIKQ